MTAAEKDPVLVELRLMREQLAQLTAELRAKKRKAFKRLKTLAKRTPVAQRQPTELEVARARRALR